MATMTNAMEQSFNSRQAGALARVTQRQLIYWDKKGLVRPSVRLATGRGSQRIYSCLDVLALKMTRSLREVGFDVRRISACVRLLRGRFRNTAACPDFCRLVILGESIRIVTGEAAYLELLRRPTSSVARHVIDVGLLERQLRQEALTVSHRRIQEILLDGMAYQLDVQQDPKDGFITAVVPGLPGCFTQARTMAELLKNAKDAIESWLAVREDLSRKGIQVPLSKTNKRGKVA